ncbi:MAG: regulatory protein RecX [Saprospiraceae bacterium]
MEDTEFNKKKTYWTPEQAWLLIQKYCAVQERCHQEVRYKLINHGIYGDMTEELIARLITDNFLDEERYAKTFARGKFRIKNWGKNKILYELKKKNVSAYSIKEALKEIEDDHYKESLKTLLVKKSKTIKAENKWEKQKKLIAFALSKGYEFDQIKVVIEGLLGKNP